MRRNPWYCWGESYEVIQDKVSLPWREKSCPVQDSLEFLSLLGAECCSAFGVTVAQALVQEAAKRKMHSSLQLLCLSCLLKTAIMWSGLPSAKHPFLHSSFLSDVY